MDIKTEKSDYVIKSHIYGKMPHDVFIVRYNLDSETPSSVMLDKDVTLSALLEKMGDSFIPQKEITQVVEDLQEVGGAYFFPKDVLAFAKEQVVRAITAYDSSDKVNQFTYSGLPLWLDQQTRAGLAVRFNAEEAMGKAGTTLWAGDVSLPLNIEQGRKLLYAIEVYASTCFDTTAAHKAAVMKIETIDEVVSYDYTKNYPEKLNFKEE